MAKTQVREDKSDHEMFRRQGDSREQKEDDKDRVECPGWAHNFPWGTRDTRRVRVTASRRTRPSHRDWNTKNEPPAILLPSFSRPEIPSFFPSE